MPKIWLELRANFFWQNLFWNFEEGSKNAPHMDVAIWGLTMGAKSGPGHFGEAVDGINVSEHSFFEAGVMTGALKNFSL